MAAPQNRLYYGDNLDILREVADGSVRLVYLDPPFKSHQEYNVLFKERDGSKAASQERAFSDTWTWGEASREAFNQALEAGGRIRDVMQAFQTFLGDSDMMAYLAMMAPRLIALHQKLTDDGSLYLHCDPTASHYLKLLLDAIFGPERFRNEIIWRRTNAHSASKKFAPVHDVILYYAKSAKPLWTDERLPYEDAYLKKYYRFDDGDGRLYWRADLCARGVRKGRSGLPWRGFDPAKKGMHWKTTIDRLDKLDAANRIYFPPKNGWPQFKKYRDELKGKAMSDLWTDIERLNPKGGERVGYPTQKPTALLRRIITASTSRGDTVLDPFCGCGSTIEAAIEEKRVWIGIDITAVAFEIIHKRLDDNFGSEIHKTYTVHNLPASMPDALAFAKQKPFGFQRWILECLGVNPLDIRPGKDGGMDGRLPFKDGARPKDMVFSVKTGHIKPDDVRSLKSVMHDRKAKIGVFISVKPFTADMKKEALTLEPYRSADGDLYPSVQLLTVREIFDGKPIESPDGSIRFRIRLNPAKAKLAVGRQQELQFA